MLKDTVHACVPACLTFPFPLQSPQPRRPRDTHTQTQSKKETFKTLGTAGGQRIARLVESERENERVAFLPIRELGTGHATVHRWMGGGRLKIATHPTRPDRNSTVTREHRLADAYRAGLCRAHAPQVSAVACTHKPSAEQSRTRLYDGLVKFLLDWLFDGPDVESFSRLREHFFLFLLLPSL